MTDHAVQRDTVTLCCGHKIALCRCWKSAKFPYCDGSHNCKDNKHGPIVVTAVATDPTVDQ